MHDPVKMARNYVAQLNWQFFLKTGYSSFEQKVKSSEFDLVDVEKSVTENPLVDRQERITLVEKYVHTS